MFELIKQLWIENVAKLANRVVKFARGSTCTKITRTGSVMGGGGGGGAHSNLGCRDTFLKIVSLLENYRSEWGKRIHLRSNLNASFLNLTL